ncbi:class I SAM-dependent methyltransferase [Lactobacillus kefiranofaciens]|uniref:Class I SAM-dependent methyltransferase n=1 Tax=Lactobacillus kefiranofaciens TaxID=267818 RepID=A0AAX3UF13_9LACO|nr:class I SAM-dependent methyltransferase [Lactobacillus kefiranofaciens]AEG40616.1 possible site-specific DNA-methyltransferase (Adenine-specific) [Lactobacillus kefiranofaciens subsp. kefiranofaciens]KRL28974.1 adenine-specific DNA-methyltransferase [Lactobacillus kefiranofaciens subsp. kefirgranum DSM 10550 = JCM 8572]KRM22621.1 adenine-specific DNA-methyltransferase [Lactobacillus kefiranofaciens subsp. kefiranofaciens DSM 5016 = JCM 6985]MCJ2171734.1 class I SAM-dependent methyltransferas
MENFEKIFNQFLDCVQTLQAALNVSFTEALVETFDNLEQGKIKVENGAPDEKTVAQLSKKYQTLDYDQISQKNKVQVFTFLTLKAINDDSQDANQMPTPPAISTVVAMLMHKLLKDEQMEVVDPAVGTGNLLFSIVSQLKALNHSKDNYQLVGIDNDEEMLNLADVAAHLNNIDIDLYCQDALMPWMCPNPEAIVSDLPIGYYPVDENAKNYENRAEKGHSFAHLLLIEQIIRNLQPNGYAFLVVPKAILSGKIGAEFMPWLTKKVYLKAIVELPDDMFKNKFNQKSILVFQNHGDHATSSEVLLTKLDSLKKEEALIRFNVKLDEWYTKITH